MVRQSFVLPIRSCEKSNVTSTSTSPSGKPAKKEAVPRRGMCPEEELDPGDAREITKVTWSSNARDFREAREQ
jgi:hypothetical protein